MVRGNLLHSENTTQFKCDRNLMDWKRIFPKQSLRCKSSMYHSIGNCVFLFLEAVLTFEHEHIVRASEAINACLAVCNRHRKKNTISESIGKTFKRVSPFGRVLWYFIISTHQIRVDNLISQLQHNYEQYTEIEAHAELCAAEALLLKALLTFIEDETLTSLIKGGIKIRTCFNYYKWVESGIYWPIDLYIITT